MMIPVIEKVANINVGFSIAITGYSVFYLLCGKYLYDETPKCFRNKKRNVILLFLCIVVIVGMNYFLYPEATYYVSYSSPLIAAMCMLLFVLVKDIYISEKYRDALWSIDRLCFGAYLVHPVFTNFIYKFLKLTPLSFGAMYPVAILGFWCVFVLCGFLSSKVMSYIKPLKKYVL